MALFGDSRQKAAPAPSGGLPIESPVDAIRRQRHDDYLKALAPAKGRFTKEQQKEGKDTLSPKLDWHLKYGKMLGPDFLGGPDFTVLPGDAVCNEGAAAMDADDSLATCLGRGASYTKQEGVDRVVGVLGARYEQAVSDIDDLAKDPAVPPEKISFLRVQAADNYEKQKAAYMKELGDLVPVLEKADAANLLFQQTARKAGFDPEASPSVLRREGEGGYARAEMMDALVGAHLAHCLDTEDLNHGAVRPEAGQDRARLQVELEDAFAATRTLPPGEAESVLYEARVAADREVQSLLEMAKAIEGDSSPAALAFKAAISRYEADSDVAAKLGALQAVDIRQAILDGKAELNADGQLAWKNENARVYSAGRTAAIAAIAAEPSLLDGGVFLGTIKSSVAERSADVQQALADNPGHVAPDMPQKVWNVLFKHDALETELILARQEKDVAALRLLVAGRSFLDASGKTQEADQVSGAVKGLVRGRANAPDFDMVTKVRAEAYQQYQRESIDFLRAELPGLEEPDNIPELQILRVQADAASGHLKFRESWELLRAVQKEPGLEAMAARGMAYGSIIRSSLAFKAVAGATHWGRGFVTHVAAMLWAVTKTATQLGLKQGTEFSRAIASGQDPHQGIGMALGVLEAAGTGIGQAWGMIALSETLRQAQKRNRMERDNQLRARLQNKQNAIKEVTRNRREGLEAVADYMQGAYRFRDAVKAVATADSGDRDTRLKEALALHERLNIQINGLKQDHSEHKDFILKHPELSPEALRIGAAQALGKFGLGDEAAAFDAKTAMTTINGVSAYGKQGTANVHQAVDAGREIERILEMEAPSEERPDARPLTEIQVAIRDLVNNKRLGSHGPDMPNCFTMHTANGPVAVMMYAVQPPVMAVIPMDVDEKGNFKGFKANPEVYDLMEKGGDLATWSLRNGNPEAHVAELEKSFPAWCDQIGLTGPEAFGKRQALQDYLKLAQTSGHAVLDVRDWRSVGELQRLRNAGIMIPPVHEKDTGGVLEVSEASKVYWRHYANAPNTTDKLRAALTTAIQSCQMEAPELAPMAFVEAARARARRLRQGA